MTARLLLEANDYYMAIRMAREVPGESS